MDYNPHRRIRSSSFLPLLFGKGAGLIAGYNTASEEEKSKYHEKKLCRTVGVYLLSVGGMTALLGAVKFKYFIAVYIGVLIAATALCLWFANRKCKK